MWIIENIVATIITEFVIEFLKLSYDKLVKYILNINKM